MVNDGKDFDILDGKSGNGVDGKMLTMVTSVMLVEVMLSVGGPSFDDSIFSTLVSSSENRTTFVNSAIKEWN